MAFGLLLCMRGMGRNYCFKKRVAKKLAGETPWEFFFYLKARSLGFKISCFTCVGHDNLSLVTF